MQIVSLLVRMSNSFLTWVSGIGGVVTIVVAILTAFKVVPEAKNLRGRDVKDLLDLIDERERWWIRSFFENGIEVYNSISRPGLRPFTP